MAVAHDIEALLARFGTAGKLRVARVDDALIRTSPRTPAAPAAPVLPLAWSELDAVLPDGGLPRGVVELTAPRALGGSTSVALAAICAGQARNTSAWCAWLDPEATLHAPAVFAAGVDLARMLVVRSPRAQLARVAVKVVASGAFEVVVIDIDAIPRVSVMPGGSGKDKQAHKLIRKLALAAEPSGATVLLLTDASKPRALPWPVAMRIELSRPNVRELVVRVAKDRRGRIGLAKTIPFRLVPKAAV
jgi:recombination protein RecA